MNKSVVSSKCNALSETLFEGLESIRPVSMREEIQEDEGENGK
jgi:hypothetical protein